MTAPVFGEDGPVYLTTAEVAERFRTAASTVREWRQAGYGPLGIRVGKRVLYPLPEVEKWEQRLTAAERAAYLRRANPGGVAAIAGRG